MRPGLDVLMKAVARREIYLIAPGSVKRLGDGPSRAGGPRGRKGKVKITKEMDIGISTVDRIVREMTAGPVISPKGLKSTCVRRRCHSCDTLTGQAMTARSHHRLLPVRSCCSASVFPGMDAAFYVALRP